MLTRPIAAALLLGGSASAAAAAAPKGPPRKLTPQQFQRDLHGSSPRSTALRKKFLDKATFVGGRRLGQDDDGYKNWAANQYDDAWQKYNAYYNNFVADDDRAGEDDDYDVDGGYEEDEDAEQQQWDNGYVFNPASYALSYHRCAAVQQYDDKVAASDNTDSVFKTQNFAVFRFCPAATCDAEIEEQEDQNGNQNGGRRRRLEDAAAEEEGEVEEEGEAEEDGQGEEEEQEYEYPEYGARGKGCRRNYGEYLMALEDFLQMMTEDQQERLEEYCTYCEEYMYEIYQNYVNNCMQNYNCRHRNLKFDEVKGDRDLQRELGFNYGICQNVANVCNDALDDSLTEYFECAEAGGVYVGPHCGADGFSVTLGVYADDECNKYVGGDVANYIGQDVDEEGLMSWYNSRHGALDFLYEGEEESLCISCAKNENIYEQLQKNQSDDDANADDDNEEEDEAEGEISELCEAVYESSARCDRHYRSFRKGTLSQQEWSEMQLSCAFIESIDMGNYDEMGYVNLKHHWNFQGDNAPEWARDNMYVQEYGGAVADVSPLQIVGLVFSILACIVLGAWSKSLHSSLRKWSNAGNGANAGTDTWSPRSQWSAKKNFFFRRQGETPGVAPAESGIGATRVRSEHSAYYLS